MDREQFRIASELLLRALSLPPGERAALLEGTEPAVRAEVERMLRSAGEATPFRALAEEIRAVKDAIRTVAPGEMGNGGEGARVGTEVPGATVGRYRLLQVIGEGGFGTVFMAEQQEPLRRRVALKVIKPGMDTGQVIARFEAERQALAMMDHPNIAKVFDAGATEGGRPYFVMELVNGVPITRYCDAHKVPTRGRLELFGQVCRAVQHAHHRGVIHRDIKPSNVLVTLHDGVPVPKVIDFGIAKATQSRLTERTLFTEFRQIVGTPEYMSPEQAEMSGLDIDTRTDVYSLGVLLYELLTGTTPLDGPRLRNAAYDELQRMIREVDPPKPSTRLGTLGETLGVVAALRATDGSGLGKSVRGELDWIVMRALEKDRTRRYESASAFGQDVDRHLQGLPVEAGPPSAAYRIGKFARRNRGLLAGAGCVAATVLVAVAGMGVALVKTRAANARIGRALSDTREAREAAEREKDRAETALGEARAARAAADARGYSAALVAAGASLRLHDVSVARAQLDRAPAALRGFEWGFLDVRADASVRTLHADQAEPTCAAVSEDWGTVATGSAGVVTLWSFDPFEERKTVRAFASAVPLASVALDSVGRFVAAASDCTLPVQVWKTATGERVGSFGLDTGGENGFVELRFSPDGSRLAANVRGTRWMLRMWDVAGGRLLWRSDDSLPADQTGVAWSNSIAFSPDGTRVVSAGAGNTLVVRNAADGSVLLTTKGRGAGVLPVAFSPDGASIASGSADGSVRVLRAQDGEELGMLRGEGVPAWGLAWSPDGERVAAGSGNAVRLFDLGTSEATAVFNGHRGGVLFLQFSRDGSRMLSAGADRAAKVWDVRNVEEAWLEDSGEPGPRMTVTSPVESVAATLGVDGRVRFWDLNTGVLRRVHGPVAPGGAVAFSHDGRWLAVAAAGGGVDILDPAGAGSVVSVGGLRDRNGDVRALAFAPDGRTLAVGGCSFMGAGAPEGENLADLRLFELPSGREVRRIAVEGMCVGNLAWSPDGRRLAVGDWNGSAAVWDAAAGVPVYSVAGGGSLVEFSHDGERLLAAGAGRIAILGAATGEEVVSAQLHPREVTSAHFSPDDRRIVTCGDDQLAKIIDGATLDPLVTLNEGVGKIDRAAFSADGGAVVADCFDRVVVFSARAPTGAVRDQRAVVNAAERAVRRARRSSGSLDDIAGAVRSGVGLDAGTKAEALRLIALAGEPGERAETRPGGAAPAPTPAVIVRRETEPAAVPAAPERGIESVMSPGMQISATTERGTIVIGASAGFERSFTWDGATRSVVMWPRKERWYGNKGLYFPGTGEHWKDHGGITRAVVEEGHQNFATIDEALEWVKARTWISLVYRDDGLVVGWTTRPEQRTLAVEVWQIDIDGRKPGRLPGSQNEKITVTTGAPGQGTDPGPSAGR